MAFLDRYMCYVCNEGVRVIRTVLFREEAEVPSLAVKRRNELGFEDGNLIVGNSRYSIKSMDPGIAFFFNGDTESSSDSEGETTFLNSVAISASALALAKTVNKKGKNIRKKWLVEEVENCKEKDFQQDFRVTRNTYKWLLSQIENGLQNFKVGPNTVPPKKQLLATIWILATPDSCRSVAKQFGMSPSTLHKCVRRVVEEINTLSPKLICWPRVEERMAIEGQIVHWGNIPGVVGAIDGTYIPIKAPTQNPESYNNRKCFHSITLQAICDHQRRFTDIFVGYPSSVGDARIFRNSDFFKAVTTNANDFFSEQEIILGDRAYPLLRWCIPPYIDTGNLGRREINFNKMHAKTRQVIERSFALLFGRFRRLQYLDMSRTDLAPNVVLACCILHNLCLMFPNELLENYEAESRNFVIGDEDDAEVNAREAIEMMRLEGQHLRDQIAENLLHN